MTEYARQDSGADHTRLEERHRAAFARAERNGLMLAAQIRTAALCVVILWDMIDSTSTGLAHLYDLSLVAIFAVLGVVQYFCASRQFHMDVLKYLFIAVDCALLSVVLCVPDPFEETQLPPAVKMNGASFLYFYLFLMQAAFSFRPSLTIWCGVCIVAARTGMLLWFLRGPDVFTNLNLSDRSAEALVQARADPNFLFLGFWSIEVLVTLILAAGLAALVRRSRRLVYGEAVSERARANLARYFSPNVLDRLSQSSDVLHAAREQEVAVLFADIMGFTTLCETAAPDEVIALLRGYHDRLGKAVFENGGTLDKYIGDGLMATFGTPDPAPDDAGRALRCAIEMISALDAWNAERLAEGHAPVRVGIGVHYGPVIAGDIGNARRLEYSVIGDTVNTASRLEHLTRILGTSLVVSESLIAALQPGEAALRAQLSEAGPQEVRGREGGVRVWVLGSPV